MSFSSRGVRTKKPKSSASNANGKCGEITFCLQVGNRVYALNCLFCPQIFLQWDVFINHMEEEHDEELSSSHLIQEENCEELTSTYKSKESTRTKGNETAVQIPESNTLTGISNEFEESACSTATDLDGSDPLVLPAINSIKAESYQAADLSFESNDSAVCGDRKDQTCSNFDEEFLNRYNEKPATSYAEQTENHDYEGNNKTLHMEVPTDLLLSEINLTEILNCFKGQNVMSYYKANNSLDRKTRRILCDLIIDKIFDKGWKMRSRDIPYITEKIIEIFPAEDRLQYFIPRQVNNNRTPGGFMYHRYYNRMKRVLQRPIVKRKRLKRTIDTSSQD